MSSNAVQASQEWLIEKYRIGLENSKITPCIVLEDWSFSMGSEYQPPNSERKTTRRQGLMDGFREGVEAILKRPDLRDVIRFNRMRFADSVKSSGWQAADEIEFVDDGFGGMTYMGHAINEALNTLQNFGQELNAAGCSITPATILVISDGEVTDKPATMTGVKQLHDLVEANRAFVIGAGVTDADAEYLEKELKFNRVYSLDRMGWDELFRRCTIDNLDAIMGGQMPSDEDLTQDPNDDNAADDDDDQNFIF